MRSTRLWISIALGWAAGAGQAAAGIFDDVRVGAAAHNIVNTANTEEGGVNVDAEIVFTSPELLEVLGRPRPYLMVSANTSGETSWTGIGFYWRWEFADGWALEPGLGYVVHDGWIGIKFPPGDPRNESRILFGSRDLFRETIAIEREFGPRFGMQIFFEHLSHGQIIGSGHNQGTEDLGVRTIWRFREQ